MRRLILAMPNPTIARKLQKVLEQGGLTVAATCGSGAQTLQAAASSPEGGVVVATLTFQDMTVQQLMPLLPDSFDCLALLKSSEKMPTLLPGLYTLGEPINGMILVSWCRQLLETRQIQIHKGVKTSQLSPGDKHGRSREEEKLIQSAKYVLMNRRRIDEPAAHRYLQQRSMQSGLRLAEMAARVLAGQ